ncbi:MAG: AAA family ATPase, partial [Clostridia bacterium]|nr:AAA family ATPase [Clostridia bacterium]
MYIENIKIGNFGKLSNKEIELSSGVNVIEGNNESGKTTLSEFIKFVFYGLSNKNSDGEMSERKRHISWKTNDVSGSVVINTEKGRFRIERSMVPHGAGYKDNITVVDLSNNAVITDIKNPGEHFFGIPEDVFTKTVYVRQAEGAYFNGESIGQAVENIFYSADESVNTEKALKKLDEARVGIKHKKNTGRGLFVQLEQERDSLVLRLSEARIANEQILQTESSLRFSEQSIEKNKKDCEKMSRQLRKIEIINLLK